MIHYTFSIHGGEEFIIIFVYVTFELNMLEKINVE